MNSVAGLTRTMSRPARGEWIEIYALCSKPGQVKSRPARGEWIEIAPVMQPKTVISRLAPRGASGLKSSMIAVELRQ